MRKFLERNTRGGAARAWVGCNCPEMGRSRRAYHVVMTNAVRELYDQAAELPAEDRAELAGLLLESLEEERDPGVEDAWAAEVARRMADYRAGRVKTVSWTELRAHLHRSDR